MKSASRVNLFSLSTLFSRLLPGPVTLVVPRGKLIPEHVNPNCETIGIRIPDNSISRKELAKYKIFNRCAI